MLPWSISYVRFLRPGLFLRVYSCGVRRLGLVSWRVVYRLLVSRVSSLSSSSVMPAGSLCGVFFLSLGFRLLGRSFFRHLSCWFLTLFWLIPRYVLYGMGCWSVRDVGSSTLLVGSIASRVSGLFSPFPLLVPLFLGIFRLCSNIRVGGVRCHEPRPCSASCLSSGAPDLGRINRGFRSERQSGACPGGTTLSLLR